MNYGTILYRSIYSSNIQHKTMRTHQTIATKQQSNHSKVAICKSDQSVVNNHSKDKDSQKQYIYLLPHPHSPEHCHPECQQGCQQRLQHELWLMPHDVQPSLQQCSRGWGVSVLSRVSVCTSIWVTKYFSIRHNISCVIQQKKEHTHSTRPKLPGPIHRQENPQRVQ